MSDTGRLETFADGVFAIAITLLVLGIHLPRPDVPLGPALLAALARRERPRGYWLGVPIYLGITLLALINPWLSLIGFAALEVYWALPISGTSGEPR